MRIFSGLLFFCLCILSAHAQSGYKIDFKVTGLADTTLFLGFFYGENTLLKDTARANSQGNFYFDNAKSLAQGTYFLVLQNGKEKAKLLDFVVGSDQHFKLETSTADYIGQMKVTGDEDNLLFFQNMAFNAERQKEAEPFIKTLQDSTLTPEQKKDARAEFQKISAKVFAYQDDIVANHPNTVTSKIFKATKEVQVPDPPKKADGTIDSSFQFHYYRDHYFDYFDLADDANIRMPRPFYRDKVFDYLDRLFIQHPDTITKAIAKLVDKVKGNQETYKYLVWICIGHYQTPKIMGLDEVYVNLVDKYFKSGAMDFWIDPKTKENLIDYANKVRLAMIGRTAPNLMMQDQNLQPKSLYDIKKNYTIVFFFDPDCGHCREETPTLVEFYNKNKLKYNFEVYAVSLDTSMKKMRDFAKEMKTNWITVNGPRTYIKTPYNQLYFAETTPTIYIIDEKKKVIARKLSVADLPDFFEKHEKMTKRNAGTSKGT